ncbi:hypothetical protein FOXYS1_9615 [Fusarium oxysporum]|uniref:Uncharacterized protein n=1 Tax=Fusarium oxysporum TaxID=5507 RepID=A0A8H5A8N3_FUSOX|nr:hypothetical protein FOXYS1_9615 [Fusarium oxysporum]
MRIKEQANRPGAKPSAKKPQGMLQALTSEASIHLQQVIERDTQYREALSQPRATANDAGTNTFPATSLWLDRTQWPSIYRDSRRDVLRALTRLPDRHSLDNDYILAQGTLDGAQDLISPRKDERKVSFIMKALDYVINSCEDTVRATSHNLLCWLLSSRLQSRREFGFKLVVERSSEIRYRRTQKHSLAFVLSIGIPQRPDAGQFECFNQVRAKYRVLGSQYPLAELISLRDFGRNVTRTEPPSMLFHWSSDGETVSHATLRVTMNEFRKLPDYFITQAEALCDRLMFGIQPNVDLSTVKDDISSSKSGYSFIKYPENGLESAYLELLVHAYTAGRNGLARDGVWRWYAVTAYLKQVSKMEEQLAGGLYTACGQTPRIRELLSLEYENGPNTSCGIYVWGSYMAYVIRHHKAKRLTNREFYVVRFLPVRLGHVLFKYLVYIRRVADLLRHEQLGADRSTQQCLHTRLLFQNNGRPWPISRLTDIVTKATLELWRQSVNVRRQSVCTDVSPAGHSSHRETCSRGVHPVQQVRRLQR